MKGHVGHYDHRLQKDGKALVTEGRQRHGGDLRVVPEQADQSLIVPPAHRDQHHQQYKGGFQGKDGSLPYPVVFACAVVEGRHRLQALSHADGNREDEHKNAGHDAHARHGGIAVAAGGNVQQHPADAVQSLTAKAGRAACKDLQKLARLPGDGGKPELADRFAPQEHIQQNAKADGLAEGGGDTGTGSAQP